MKFSELGLSPKVLAAVEASGYTEPTPIQEGAIPHVLEGRDVLGIAQTGTGKTASFVLPMLTQLEKGRARARMPRTLILEPTRELAAQVHENFEKYGSKHKLSVALLIGGVSFKDQVRILDKGADVLIATPGRLLDLFERGNILLTGCQLLVIDEADRMLDMGFIPDIERIVKMLPFTRQTLFFSATMPPPIEKLAAQFLSNPVPIEVARASSTSDTITQRLVAAPGGERDKTQALADLIDTQEIGNAIIFCNRKRDVASVDKVLRKKGYDAGALHGDMDQSSRTRTLESFREGNLKLLVASDVAARGLDIPDVSHVFNYDVPIHAEDYVHRIGRTGRAGREGAAFTLVTPDDKKYLDAILHLTGDAVAWQDDAEQEYASRGRGGRSRSKPAEAKSSDDGSGPGESKPKRTRRKKSEPEARPEPADAVAESVETYVETKPETREEAPSPRSQRNARAGELREKNARRGRNRNRDDDGPTPQGMGDHVPPFMMQAVKLPD